MKKGLLLASVVASSFISAACLTSCKGDDNKMKVGVVCIGDENATYDKNFMEALDKVVADKNVEVIYKTQISEDGDASYQAATELVELGCEVVVGNSFGFEDNILQCAKENEDVLFGHCTGVKAHTEKLSNYCNGFASIYEGRYLAGIAAGMKLEQLGDKAADHVLGYVGAFPYAEVISGYTAFYLGAKSVCDDVTMKVQFTNSWGDVDKETTAAASLVLAGAKLISQHADTYGAPTYCDQNGIMNVSYNKSTEPIYPNTYLCYSAINWQSYFSYLVDCKRNNVAPEYDYTGTLNDGAVVVGRAGINAAPNTQETLDIAANELKAGTRHVFDTSMFTVGGLKQTSFMFEGKNAIKTDGVNSWFDESAEGFQSAPYFSLEIDGIEKVNA